ncbi:hypothetical protein BaRGS_00012862 [Batillaria attramentaria]|uniref:Uncharacterized protein n=1 Tax=Batillaria attramentaria TaxID=370345 RepID=A0ABD0L8T3_9CAEN
MKRDIQTTCGTPLPPPLSQNYFGINVQPHIVHSEIRPHLQDHYNGSQLPQASVNRWPAMHDPVHLRFIHLFYDPKRVARMNHYINRKRDRGRNVMQSGVLDVQMRFMKLVLIQQQTFLPVKNTVSCAFVVNTDG